MKRHATAIWNGSGKDGTGHLTTQSTILNQTAYSFNSRFADGMGTNPEELVAAAHAGCFTMKLSFSLDVEGFTAETIETTAYIHFENGAIVGSHLVVTAKIPLIDQLTFEKCVKDAEVNCPISRVLNAKITVDATLDN
jgi:lipoyl-dependent peroxiredoxin